MSLSRGLVRAFALVSVVASAAAAQTPPSEGALPNVPSEESPTDAPAAAAPPSSGWVDAAEPETPPETVPTPDASEPNEPDFSSDVAADEEEASEERDPDAQLRRVSLTFSPIHLFFPVLEVTGEVRVARKLGLAVLGGYGSITSEREPGDSTGSLTARVFELGAQARYYVVGSFDHGMQLGAELLYVHLDDAKKGSIVGSGQGVGFGPFVGYKIATRVGFTFDGQVGFQYVGVRAEAHDTESSDSAEASDSAIVPLFNANIGWSF